MIVAEKEVYDRVMADKKEFQKTMDDGRWSMSDTIKEYQKMIDTLTE